MNLSLGTVEYERQKYVNWLASRVDGNLSFCGHTFSRLLSCLFDIPFVPVLDKDQSRAEDGNKLRLVYKNSNKIRCSTQELFNDESGCTFLEFLVSISERVNDILYDPETDRTGIYFWDFLHNVGLDDFSDDTYGVSWDMFKLTQICSRIMNRAYNPDGTGGLFPLRKPREDQRTVEIWYQLQAYLQEKITRKF